MKRELLKLLACLYFLYISAILSVICAYAWFAISGSPGLSDLPIRIVVGEIFEHPMDIFMDYSI